MNKSRIIHIDGTDKTGKDTVRDLLVKETQGNCLVIVRSYLSQIVYSRLYDRKIDEDFFWNKMKIDFDNGVEFVVLECNLYNAERRFKEHNEKDISILDFENHRYAFKMIVEEAQSKGIKIKVFDTSYDTPADTFNKILES